MSAMKVGPALASIYKPGWWHTVKLGERLRVSDLYNQTTNPRRCRLPAGPSEIMEIKHTQSQSNVMFRVLQRNGESVWLDAGWFYPPKGQGDA